MKLSTRSRYGTKMMVDLAQHFEESPVRINDIAKRLDISVKYLEQLIIPLKKAKFIKSVRGPKGGHMLSRPPEEITMGDIVRILENDVNLVPCLKGPGECVHTSQCLTRNVWKKAASALFETLDSMTLTRVIKFGTEPPVHPDK